MHLRGRCDVWVEGAHYRHGALAVHPPADAHHIQLKQGLDDG